jgi:hypothetical protein
MTLCVSENITKIAFTSGCTQKNLRWPTTWQGNLRGHENA